MMDDEALQDNGGPDSGHRALRTHPLELRARAVHLPAIASQRKNFYWRASSRAETLRWQPFGPGTSGPLWTIP